MYPGHWAGIKPEAPAIIHAETGMAVSWRELDDRSNAIVNLLRSRDVAPGDHIALLMENHVQYFDIAWAAFRSGIYITCINRYLTAEEAAYIVNDSGAKVIFGSAGISTCQKLLSHLENCPHRFLARGELSGWENLETVLTSVDSTPREVQLAGDSMLYSSGTTGQPKGIKRPLSGQPVALGIPGVDPNSPYKFDERSIYLSPAPLYHAAPFGFCMRTLSLGGTVVMMEKFDATKALQNLQTFKITHSQWVPTMFIRMLKLPAEVREQYDLSHHQCAIHAAAPCPVAVKQEMMDWWGPIIWEYYAGTERNGSTIIGPQEWLAHPGSVGRAASGILHICNEDGIELPAGDEGLVYFEQPQRPFNYHNAPEKTAESGHPLHPGWTALGDVGYVDEEGYLYLTDRKAYLIISGGVNIYPQEIEDVLIMHPSVADIAVLGVPNNEFGEEVKAVIQLAEHTEPSDALKEDLTGHAREHLAGFKVPRSIDFIEELPRLPTGKLYKRKLREQYWP